MIKVLWHGRGGQGAFTAARLLGAAGSLAEGKHALAFPSFGPERRGAPIRAYTKLDSAPIGDRSAFAKADYVVYLDETLLGEGWDEELAPGATVLVNSKKASHDARMICIDADGLSTQHLGRAIPNTVFLGALAQLCDQLALADVEEAIRLYMPARLQAKNLAVVAAAAEKVANARSHARVEGEDASSAVQAAKRSGDSVSRPACEIPVLHEGCVPRPQEYAHTTCYRAGHLVSKNAGWRSVRPVVDAGACTACLQCYLYCPDGTVFKTGAEKGSDEAAVAFDYDFCKGCGVCASVCSFGAVQMIPERASEEVSA